MELRQLRYFLKVAEVGSITRAATALNISQPSVTHGIKTLEQSLGVLLFIRGGSGVTLSGYGEIFLGYATHVLREADKIKDEMTLLKGGGSSKLTIGIMTGFSQSFLSGTIARFMETHPQVQVEVHSFSTNEKSLDCLRQSIWDVAITLINDDSDAVPDIEVMKMGQSSSTVYCGKEHPLAACKNVTLEQLADHKWTVTTLGSGERLLNDQFNAIGKELQVQLRTNSYNHMTESLKTAPLLCLGPTVSMLDDLARGDIVRVDQNEIYVGSWVSAVYSNLSVRTPALRDFMSLCTTDASKHNLA